MSGKVPCLAAICLLWCAGAAAAQNAVPVPDSTFKLIYCRAGSEGVPSKWETGALLGIARTSGVIKPPRSIMISRRVCGDDFPDATCFAGPGGLICRGTGIERIMRATAFLLSAWLIDGAPGYEDFQARNDRAVVNAFRAADGIGASPAAEDLVERIRSEDSRPDGVRPARAEDQSLAALYRLVLDRVLAVVVGHELSHVNGDVCPIAVASLSEDNKTWGEAVGSHMKNDLFCDRAIVPIELTADRCALRFLRAVDEKDASISSDKHVDTMRRLAAELAAYLGFFGLRATDPPGRLVPFRLPGYLHEAFRSLLFAAEMHGNRPRPAVCGTAARIFVQAVQATFKQCSGKGTVSDPILALLPPGVEKSWNGEPWAPASWTCKP